MRFLKSLSEKGFKQELVKTTQNAEIASDNTFNTYKEGQGSGEGGEREWRDRTGNRWSIKPQLVFHALLRSWEPQGFTHVARNFTVTCYL